MDDATKPPLSTNLADQLIVLSQNLWWSWNPQAQSVFAELSPYVWESTCHNPVAVLRSLSRQELEARLRDRDLAERVRAVVSEFHQYEQETETWAATHPNRPLPSIAYFSAEFGLHESLRVYSGGLGVLAGDHAKSASDLGLSFVGVSLFYRDGYFEQRLTPEGWQYELYVPHKVDDLPLQPIVDANGNRIIESVEIGHSTVSFTAWKLDVGRIQIYLLDTNIPENDQHFQKLSANVYGGDMDTRIGQEIVLGIGGVRLLRSLGIHPDVFHMNEGHSAFLVLELLREQLSNGVGFDAALDSVRSKCVFTTHTPVPAGHDRFSSELLAHSLGRFWRATGLSHDTLMGIGRVRPEDESEAFTMTVLALKMSKASNAVSELHGRTSREMWRSLYPDREPKDVPIGFVTNGVHTPSWATARAHEFWNKRLGFDWTAKLLDRDFWRRIEEDGLASDEELWAFRYTLRRELVEFVRKQIRRRYPGGEEGGFASLERVLSPDALTICFARRFATYKRAPLLFRHLDRVLPLFADPERPIQIVFAGKAHPRDHEGKRFLQHIVELSRHPQLFGRVVFVEEHNIAIGRALVSGADVWLNNPRRPLEASGTSGMKAVIHGGLNLSILDGWWREGYDGSNGWAIGEDNHFENDLDAQDEHDFEKLISILTEKVIPEFYERDESGIPRAWIKRIRHAMRTLLPEYNTERMVAEYVERSYRR
ncbi:MAG: glycosyltransferase family 1 protein [Ignavibacteria bacterium]|nr:glycosyltransferase family 1 protein [Ignavibacteria bacterium]